MQIYLVAAYVVAWVGIFVYLAIVAVRIRGVRTELAAVQELVREHQERQERQERQELQQKNSVQQ